VPFQIQFWATAVFNVVAVGWLTYNESGRLLTKTFFGG
jgi:hypothetical protein